MHSRQAEQKAMLLLLVAVSAAFAWIIQPLFSAVFWAAVLALLFTPAYRRLTRAMNGRRSLAAATTLLLCLTMVILPLGVVTAALANQTALVYQAVQSGKIAVGTFLHHLVAALPEWATTLLDSVGLGDLASIQDKLAASAAQAAKFLATRAVNIGQNAVSVLVSAGITLYLLFFFLRDGQRIVGQIERAIPLSPEDKAHLFSKFATVTRATIKGNLVIALVQGALGGFMLKILGIQPALLLGVLMALLSLLPLVGAFLVWIPIALWLLLTGSLWKGSILVVFGVFVIGLVDNVLRPILVGKDTQMPDYLVLISTLGGIAVFGAAGIVIGPAIAALFISVWDLFSSRPGHHAGP